MTSDDLARAHPHDPAPPAGTAPPRLLATGTAEPAPVPQSEVRALLEAAWRARVDDITRLSTQLLDLEADPDDPLGSAGQREALEAELAAAWRSANQHEEALQRLAEGRYGRCERCGGQISAARLDVLPDASRCTGCQQEVGRG